MTKIVGDSSNDSSASCPGCIPRFGVVYPLQGMRVLCLALLFLFVMAPQALALGQQDEQAQQGDGRVEKYQYEAIPEGKENETEEIGATLSFEENGIELASVSLSEKGQERILLKMTGSGDLISGTRSFTSSSGSVAEQKIWREGSKAYVERISAKERKTVELDIPKGAILAVEGSMLVLLRFFPCDDDSHWNLFLIDFTGKSAAATASSAGTERVVVPAGEFSCYRIEVLFHVPLISIINPKVVCWLTEEKPHVVVRSVGKRGFFTPKYVTSLISERLPASEAAEKGSP